MRWHLGPASCHVGTCVAVPEPMRERAVELTRLWVQPGQRGRGHASRLLERVASAVRGHVLIVSAEPYRKGGMDADSLATWYGRHGFVTIQDEPRIMARACHG